MANVLTVAIFIASLGQGESGSTTLGTYRIDGRDVAATVPSAAGPIGAGAKFIELNGDKYLLSPEGRLVRRYRFEGGWSEVRGGYADAKSKWTAATPEWRVKVFVMPRAEILDVAKSGLARVRRSTMEAVEIAQVAESAARFASMAEAEARGRLRISFEFEVDHDAALQTALAGARPFDAGFWADYLRPRVNGGTYEAEDRVNRGPFDSIFVVHAGLCAPTVSTAVADMPVTPIAFYAEGPPDGPNALAIAFYNGWVRHLAFAAQKGGYRLSADGTTPIRETPGEYGQGYRGRRDFHPLKCVPRRDETPTDVFLAHRGPPSVGERNWAEVAEDPLGRLPLLEAGPANSSPLGSAAALIPFQNDVFGPSNSSGSPLAANLDNRLEAGAEASALVSVPGQSRSLLLVEAPFVELFGERLRTNLNPKVLGYLTRERRLFFVFAIDPPTENQPEAALLEGSGFPTNLIPAAALIPMREQGEVAASLEPDGSTAAQIPVLGGMSVVDRQDADRGAVLEMRLRGLVRRGSALLLGQRGGPVLLNAANHPYLSFYAKSAAAEPMVLRLAGQMGQADRLVPLFGAWPAPAESGESELPPASPPLGPDWTLLVVDLRKFGVSEVTAIYLESGHHVGSWEPRQAVPPTVFFDDLKLSKSAPGPETVFVAPSLSEAGARALGAANATADDAALQALLKDPDDGVRLNALRAYARLKSVSAEAAIIDNLRSLDVRVSEAAVEALAFQDSAGGWAALKRAVEIGPFDFTRTFAARALGRKKDSKLIGTLSLMLTAKSWRGRAYAAEAIGAVASEPQQMVLMAFLHEIDPAVRLAVTLAAGTQFEEVAKRLLWSAVNDPSDEVRAWSCFKLVQSGLAKYASEGLKGVRDDSVGMRVRFLELIRERPNEAFRPAIRLAVVDASPSVRAAGLRAFATLSGPVAKEELASTPEDPDPRVQAAYAEFRRAKP